MEQHDTEHLDLEQPEFEANDTPETSEPEAKPPKKKLRGTILVIGVVTVLLLVFLWRIPASNYMLLREQLGHTYTADQWYQASINAHDLEHALFCLDRTIERDSLHVMARYDRARLNVALENRDGAKRELQRIMRIDPTFLDAQIFLASMSLDDEDYRAAIAYAGNCIARDSTIASPWIYRGIARARLQRLDEAVEDLERGLALGFEDAGLHMSVGDYFHDHGDAVKAQHHFSRALALDDLYYFRIPEQYRQSNTIRHALGQSE